MGERSEWTLRLTANRVGRSRMMLETRLNSSDSRFVPVSGKDSIGNPQSVLLIDETLVRESEAPTSIKTSNLS